MLLQLNPGAYVLPSVASYHIEFDFLLVQDSLRGHEPMVRTDVALAFT